MGCSSKQVQAAFHHTCEALEQALKVLKGLETKLNRRQGTPEEAVDKVKDLCVAGRAAISLFVELKKSLPDNDKMHSLGALVAKASLPLCNYVRARMHMWRGINLLQQGRLTEFTNNALHGTHISDDWTDDMKDQMSQVMLEHQFASLVNRLPEKGKHITNKDIDIVRKLATTTQTGLSVVASDKMVVLNMLGDMLQILEVVPAENIGDDDDQMKQALGSLVFPFILQLLVPDLKTCFSVCLRFALSDLWRRSERCANLPDNEKVAPQHERGAVLKPKCGWETWTCLPEPWVCGDNGWSHVEVNGSDK